jgi:hypothetical protein
MRTVRPRCSHGPCGRSSRGVKPRKAQAARPSRVCTTAVAAVAPLVQHEEGDGDAGHVE